MQANQFALAPMSTDLRVMSWIVGPMPIVFGAGAIRAVGPAKVVMIPVFVTLLLIWASVYLWWRPSWFELGPNGVSVVWPVRRQEIPLEGLQGIELVDKREFRRRYGFGMRIGAGGLWGGFGLLKCGAETFRMYVSRTDRFVLLRPREGRAWIITPEDPERFVEELRRLAGG